MKGSREECIRCKHSNTETAEDHLGVGVIKRPGDSVTIIMKPEGSFL